MNPQNNTVAGIDVHKRILVVVVLDRSTPDRDHATARFGTTHQARQELVEFLRFHQVSHVAMESTAQYWRPVWMDLEDEFPLTLAQARSTHAPRGRKQDLSDARRIARRLLSGDLTASYVPGPEQREWRLLSRTRVGMLESVVRLRNQIEVLLEQAQIKLSSVVSDVLGLSGRRILHALLEGVHDPVQLAALAHYRIRTSKEDLADALSGPAHAFATTGAEVIPGTDRANRAAHGRSREGPRSSRSPASGRDRTAVRDARRKRPLGAARHRRDRTASRGIRFFRKASLLGRSVSRT